MARTIAPPRGPRAAVHSSQESPRPSATRLYPTKNDLPERSRREAIELLNQRLADCIDLQTQCKQAHWNVKGPTFIALHKLFDEGTARIVAQRSALMDYPLTLAGAEEHVAALSDALAQFGRTARIAIEEMDELQDAGRADIMTEISRGVDKWLWFVEAHQQAKA